ncbi:MAG: hypothetical protein HP491_03350 [Nitrospira sp.]|nr:hypothetical protein [Nitrospira sp.]
MVAIGNTQKTRRLLEGFLAKTRHACAWIYCVVGQYLLRKGPPPKNHPYRDWLMLYASPEFAEVQRWMRKKVDQWAKTAGTDEKRRMEESFIISSRYEWMFWDMAWKEEQWPV